LAIAKRIHELFEQNCAFDPEVGDGSILQRGRGGGLVFSLRSDLRLMAAMRTTNLLFHSQVDEDCIRLSLDLLRFSLYL